MSDPRTTFTSALWNHAGKVLEYILMYLTSVFIARGLGVQENGTFVGLFSISQLLLVLISFGLEVSLNKHIPQITGELRNERIRHVLRRVIAGRVGILGVVALVLYGSMEFVPRFVSPVLAHYLWILVAYTAVRSLVALIAIVLTAELRTRTTSAINVITRLLEAIVIGFVAAGGMEVGTVFAVLLATTAGQIAAYAVAARSQLFGKEAPHAVVPVILFGGMYWTNSVVEYFLGRHGDVLFLSTLLGDSSQASLYDVAFSVGQLASLSMTVGLGGITLATFSRLALRADGQAETFYGLLIRMTSLLSIPLYSFLLFNASSILSLLYSSKYLAATGLIQGIAAFRIVGRLFGGPENAEYLLSRSRVSTLVAIGIVGAVGNAGLDLLLIPRMAATGAVIGSGCGNLIVNILAATAVYRSSSIRMQWRSWLIVTFPTGVASFACAIFFPPQGLAQVVFQVAAFLVVVLLLFRFLKPLTGDDWRMLSQVNSRIVLPLRHFVRTDPTAVRVGST